MATVGLLGIGTGAAAAFTRRLASLAKLELTPGKRLPLAYAHVADPEDRAWWGGMWADRFTDSAVARQLIDSGDATTADLARVAGGWRSWAEAEDGWFSVLHGEILARA